MATNSAKALRRHVSAGGKHRSWPLLHFRDRRWQPTAVRRPRLPRRPRLRPTQFACQPRMSVWSRVHQLPATAVNGCCRRVSPVAPRPREGPLTEPTAGAQPWPRERVLMPLCCPSCSPTAWGAVAQRPSPDARRDRHDGNGRVDTPGSDPGPSLRADALGELALVVEGTG
jgi:hypothetical protein